jgi:hypothetical protein
LGRGGLRGYCLWDSNERRRAGVVGNRHRDDAVPGRAGRSRVRRSGPGDEPGDPGPRSRSDRCPEKRDAAQAAAGRVSTCNPRLPVIVANVHVPSGAVENERSMNAVIA